MINAKALLFFGLYASFVCASEPLNPTEQFKRSIERFRQQFQSTDLLERCSRNIGIDGSCDIFRDREWLKLEDDKDNYNMLSWYPFVPFRWRKLQAGINRQQLRAVQASRVAGWAEQIRDKDPALLASEQESLKKRIEDLRGSMLLLTNDPYDIRVINELVSGKCATDWTDRCPPGQRYGEETNVPVYRGSLQLAMLVSRKETVDKQLRK